MVDPVLTIFGLTIHNQFYKSTDSKDVLPALIQKSIEIQQTEKTLR
jgi:hypothetical protein